MNNEHNPIAHLITKIQQKWIREVSPFTQCKLIRWLIRADESKLFEGFVHLESTPNGKLPEIFVALLTEFKSLEAYSRDLISTWLDAYEKDQKTFDAIRSNGADFSWDNAYFKKQLSTSEIDFDKLLLKVFSTFHEALQMPERKLTVVLMPVSVSDITSYKYWLKRIMKITIPPNVQLCIFDYIDERFFDSVFNEFDPAITKTLLLELDLKAATNKIMQSGDPNSPPVQLRNYMLKMSEALTKKDASKLDKLGNECISVMIKSRNKLLMTTSYIMYAGMLFNFKKFEEIDVLLQKGLKIAKAGKMEGDIGCHSIISQYYGYIASNQQLNNKYKSAIEWFCLQAEILIEQTLMAPAIAAYEKAYVIAKKHTPEQNKQILHKAFIAGENLKPEELSGSDYNILCKDYYVLLRQNNETELYERVDNKMGYVAGKNWKEQISSPQKRFSIFS